MPCQLELTINMPKGMAVGMLLENVITGSSDELSQRTQVVCVAVIIKTIEHNQLDGYHCCGRHRGPNGSSILCELTVADRKWKDVVNGILITLSAFMAFFIQALPPALPDCFFNLQNECEKENCFEQQNNT